MLYNPEKDYEKLLNKYGMTTILWEMIEHLKNLPLPKEKYIYTLIRNLEQTYKDYQTRNHGKEELERKI